jgi:hypothetical protein
MLGGRNILKFYIVAHVVLLVSRELHKPEPIFSIIFSNASIFYRTFTLTTDMTTAKYPNKLRFNLNAEQISELCDKIIVDSKKVRTKLAKNYANLYLYYVKLLDDIVTIPAKERTFKNTVHALADEPFVRILLLYFCRVSHLHR